jgi:hypothetical protein
MAHPAPERHKVRFGALCFALAAPPLAWSIQSIVGYGVSSEACYPGDTPRMAPTFPGMWDVLVALNAAALVVGVFAVLVASRNWSVTRGESGGEPRHLLERGEGRTRFLAMCGLLIGAGFVVASLFSTAALVLSPLCR